MRPLLQSLLMLVFATSLCALDEVDPTFAPIIRGPGLVRDLAYHPSGWVYASVDGDKLDGHLLDGTFIRFSEAGVWDSTYQPTTDGHITEIFVQPDNKIIVAGEFTSFDGHTTSNVARLHGGGSVDTSFTVAAGVVTFVTKTVAVDADGMVYVGGSRDVVYTDYYDIETSDNLMVKLNASGQPVSSFNPEFEFESGYGFGIRSDYPAPSLAVNVVRIGPDGLLYVGGNFESYLTILDTNGNIAGNSRPRIDFNGTNSTFYSGSVSDIFHTGDGAYYVGGVFTNARDSTSNGPFNPPEHVSVARVNADGTIDHSFNADVEWPGYSSFGSVVNSLHIDSDGNLVMVGDFRIGGGYSEVAQLDDNGNLIGSFYTSFAETDAVVFLPNDSLLFGRRSFFEIRDRAITVDAPPFQRVLLSGSETSDFSLDLRTRYFPQEIHIRSDGSLLLAGDALLEVNGADVPSIASLNPDGSTDSSFSPQIDEPRGVRTSVVLPGGRVLIGGRFEQMVNGELRKNLLLLEPDGSIVEDFDIANEPSATVESMHLLASDKVLIVGRFASIGDHDSNTMAVLNIDYSGQVPMSASVSLDKSFQSRAIGISYVDSVAQQPDGKLLLVGLIQEYEGNYFRQTLRLNPDGSLDSSYNPVYTAYPRDMVVARVSRDGMHIYLGGTASTPGPLTTKKSIVRLFLDGTTDTSFGYWPFINSVDDIQLDAEGGIWAVGDFSGTEDGERKHVVRLLADGSVDPNFDIGDAFPGDVQSIRLQAPGYAYVQGKFKEAGGELHDGLARINLTTPLKPLVELMPVAITRNEGESVTFNLANRSPGESYSWTFGGATLATTGPSLTLDDIDLAHSGQYGVSALNTAGATLTSAVLTVNEDSLETWLSKHQIAPGDVTLDTDGDGFSDQEEYLARTNPSDRRSFLKADLTKVNGRTYLDVPRFAGRTYGIETSPDLVDWEALSLPLSSGDAMYEIPEDFDGNTSFWRVVITKD